MIYYAVLSSPLLPISLANFTFSENVATTYFYHNKSADLLSIYTGNSNLIRLPHVCYFPLYEFNAFVELRVQLLRLTDLGYRLSGNEGKIYVYRKMYQLRQLLKIRSKMDILTSHEAVEVAAEVISGLMSAGRLHQTLGLI